MGFNLLGARKWNQFETLGSKVNMRNLIDAAPDQSSIVGFLRPPVDASGPDSFDRQFMRAK